MPERPPPPLSQATPATRRRRWELAQHAFTLVEVSMAIGVVAVGFIAVFSLLPVGLDTFRKSVDNSVGTQIMRRVVNEVRQTDFQTLNAEPTRLRYFTEEGTEVAEKDLAVVPWLYLAQITIAAPTLLPGASSGPNVDLATVVVKVANDPMRDKSLFSSARKFPYLVFTAHIARNQ